MASHIMLHELGLKHETESVDLKTHKTQKGTDFYTVNPKGYVPYLILDNGQPLSENVAILTYLGDQKPSKEDRYKSLEWLAFISTEFHKTIGGLFAFKEESTVKMIKDKAAKRLELMDKHLANQEFVVGNDFGPADAYLFTILNWCPKLDIDLNPYKNITAFMKRIGARPAVQKTMKAEGLLK